MTVKLVIVGAILLAGGVGLYFLLRRGKGSTTPQEQLPPPAAFQRAGKRDVAVAALGLGGQLVSTVGGALTARGRADA